MPFNEVRVSWPQSGHHYYPSDCQTTVKYYGSIFGEPNRLPHTLTAVASQIWRPTRLATLAESLPAPPPSPLAFRPPPPSRVPAGGGWRRRRSARPRRPPSPPRLAPPARPPPASLRPSLLRARGARPWRGRRPSGASGGGRPRWALAPAAPRPPAAVAPAAPVLTRGTFRARRPPPLLPALRSLRSPPGRSVAGGGFGRAFRPPSAFVAFRPPPPSARAVAGT